MPNSERATPVGDARAVVQPVTGSTRRRLTPWIITAIAIAVVPAVALAAVIATVDLVRDFSYPVNVTISLSYVNDGGRTYTCTYDYSTPRSAPMPAGIAQQMNERDWSQTGQLMYEWAKTHRAAAGSTWGLAMDEFVKFPPWSVHTESGSEYELWSRERPGGNCEDGLR